MPLHPRQCALAICSGALLLLAVGCAFDPVARRAKPEQLLAGPTRVIRTLDPRGSFAQIQYERDGQAHDAIYEWRRNKRCDLPPDLEAVGNPLIQAGQGQSGKPVLFLPLAVRTSRGPRLALVDERCSVHGPYGELSPDSLRTLFSRKTQRSLLLFQDTAGALSLFDPWATREPIAIADSVQQVQLASSDDGAPDQLWLREDGLLRRRGLAGELLTELGDQVTTLALSRTPQRRVAYVDGGQLFEAVTPNFRPVRVTSDGCSPRYTPSALELLSPCAERALVQIDLESGDVKELPPGIVASGESDGVTLEYGLSATGEPVLFAESSQLSRSQVLPPLLPNNTFVLDSRSLAGISATREFGVWRAAMEEFEPILHEVSAVLPHYSGRKHQYTWLVQHDVADDLGRVSLLSEGNLKPTLIASGVPTRERGGFLTDNGVALPNYPFSAPMVVLLQDAVPTLADPQRYQGKLRALLMTGEPSAVLDEEVSSFELVAAPVPGLLYGVEDGPDQGLWFVAL